MDKQYIAQAKKAERKKGLNPKLWDYSVIEGFNRGKVVVASRFDGYNTQEHSALFVNANGTVSVAG